MSLQLLSFNCLECDYPLNEFCVDCPSTEKDNIVFTGLQVLRNGIEVRRIQAPYMIVIEGTHFTIREVFQYQDNRHVGEFTFRFDETIYNNIPQLLDILCRCDGVSVSNPIDFNVPDNNYIIQVVGGIPVLIPFADQIQPQPDEDLFITDEDTPVSGNVFDNDQHAIGENVTITSFTAPPITEGTLAFNTITGDFTFTPAVGFTGVVQIPISYQDATGQTASENMLIYVRRDCCPDPHTQLNPAIFTDPNNPDTAEAQTFINGLPVQPNAGTVFFLIGNGSATEPDHAWYIDGLGNLIKIESPFSFIVEAGTTATVGDNSLGSGTVLNGQTIHFFSPQASMSITVTDGSAIVALDTTAPIVTIPNGAFADPNNPTEAEVLTFIGLQPTQPASAIYILPNNGTPQNPDFAWRHDPDAAAVTRIEEPSTVVFPVLVNAVVQPVPPLVGNPINNPQIFEATDGNTYFVDELGNAIDLCCANAPTVSSHQVTTPVNTPLNGSVTFFAGDQDGDLDPNSFALFTPPSNGGIVFSTTGTYTYTPNPDFCGQDTFTWRATDLLGNFSTPAQVIIDVPCPQTLTALPESRTTAINTPINDGDLTDDISDPTNVLDPNSFAIVTPAANGVAVLAANGTYTYTPNPNFCGVDTFTYQVQDTSGNPSNVATVTIDIPCPQQLIAQNDTEQTPFETPLVDTVNDLIVDPDGIEDTNGYTLVTPAANGLVALNPDGTYTYTPNNGFFGVDSFEYQVADTVGGTSNVAKVTITVPQPLPPITQNDTQDVPFETLINGDVAPLTTDPDGNLDPNGFASVALPTNGILAFNPDGTYTYTPNNEFCGQDSFTYQATDLTNLTSNISTVTLDVETPTPISVIGAEAAANNFATTGSAGDRNQALVNGVVVIAETTGVAADPIIVAVADGDTLTLRHRFICNPTAFADDTWVRPDSGVEIQEPVNVGAYNNILIDWTRVSYDTLPESPSQTLQGSFEFFDINGVSQFTVVRTLDGQNGGTEAFDLDVLGGGVLSDQPFEVRLTLSDEIGAETVPSTDTVFPLPASIIGQEQTADDFDTTGSLGDEHQAFIDGVQVIPPTAGVAPDPLTVAGVDDGETLVLQHRFVNDPSAVIDTDTWVRPDSGNGDDGNTDIVEPVSGNIDFANVPVSWNRLAYDVLPESPSALLEGVFEFYDINGTLITTVTRTLTGQVSGTETFDLSGTALNNNRFEVRLRLNDEIGAETVQSTDTLLTTPQAVWLNNETLGSGEGDHSPRTGNTTILTNQFQVNDNFSQDLVVGDIVRLCPTPNNIFGGVCAEYDGAAMAAVAVGGNLPVPLNLAEIAGQPNLTQFLNSATITAVGDNQTWDFSIDKLQFANAAGLRGQLGVIDLTVEVENTVGNTASDLTRLRAFETAVFDNQILDPVPRTPLVDPAQPADMAALAGVVQPANFAVGGLIFFSNTNQLNYTSASLCDGLIPLRGGGLGAPFNDYSIVDINGTNIVPPIPADVGDFFAGGANPSMINPFNNFFNTDLTFAQPPEESAFYTAIDPNRPFCSNFGVAYAERGTFTSTWTFTVERPNGDQFIYQGIVSTGLGF